MIQIFSTLYAHYGQITPQKLISKRDSETAQKYNPSEPIDQTWTAIKDYNIMAQALNTSTTNQQLMDIDKIVIQNAACFSHDTRS